MRTKQKFVADNSIVKTKITEQLIYAISEGSLPLNVSFTDLISHARINKVLFYLLLRMNKLPKNLQSFKSNLINRYEKINKTIGDIAELMENERIKYCVFKTLRPVPYLSPDIDILIFDHQSLLKAVNVVREKLHAKMDSSMPMSNYSCSFYLDREKFYVDLYAKIHVAGFTYIPKDELKSSCTTTKVKGKPVTVLEPEYELITLVGHAIFKEQVITLLDYFCVVSLLSKINFKSLEKALQRTNMFPSFVSFLDTMKRSHYFPTPIKPSEFLKLTFHKFFADPEARKTILNPLFELLQNRQKLVMMLEHFRRETY